MESSYNGEDNASIRYPLAPNKTLVTAVGYILLSCWPKRSDKTLIPPWKYNFIVNGVAYSLQPDGMALFLKTTFTYYIFGGKVFGSWYLELWC